MATDTHQRLIDAAGRRFYRDGFRNVGLDAILRDVGISKTAFYKHFQSKDDLMLAVLERLDDQLQQRFRRMIREAGGRAAIDQLHALFDVVEDLIDADEHHGCIFINAAIEFPLPHDPAHQLAARNKRAIEDIVYEIVERTGVANPQAVAEELCLVIDGAYVARQVTGDPAALATARRLAHRIIEDCITQPLAAAVCPPTITPHRGDHDGPASPQSNAHRRRDRRAGRLRRGRTAATAPAAV